jgi:hypothetical protein
LTSNVSHPGLALTNLLAARPDTARAQDDWKLRLICTLSSRGIPFGTVSSAQLPALYAATSPDAKRGGFYGPSGLGHVGGPPAEQKLYPRLRSTEEVQRVWEVSEQLTGLFFPDN